MSDAEKRPYFEISFYSAIIVVGVLTNGFIILMFSFKRKLRNVTNYFVVNLAVSDFFLSLQLILYLIAYRFFHQIEIPQKIYSNIVTSFLTLGMSASPASLVVVSFDRYYAISKPLRYKSVITHRRAIFVIVGIWVYASSMYLLNWLQLARIPEYPEVFLMLLAAGNFLFPLCAVMYFYCNIIKIALTHLRHTAQILEDVAIRRKQFRIARNIFVLVFPLLVVWSTYYIFLLRGFYCEECRKGNSKMQNAVLLHLPHVIAAINPITYIMLTKDFRLIITSKCRKSGFAERKSISNFGLPTETIPLSTFGHTK